MASPERVRSMEDEDIKKRIDALLAGGRGSGDSDARSHELFHGALNIMVLLYGPSSTQVQNFTKEAEVIRGKWIGAHYLDPINLLSEGALRNMKAEIETGLIGSLQKTITGDVLADFLQLARAALNEKGDDAKNVAAVLAAALFEDTMRRLATANGIAHIDKLQVVITELKDKGVLQGSQVGVANSYLNFRNSALHAQWDRVERESVASVLGFVEQLLIRHFS
jgi:hypothetical protein